MSKLQDKILSFDSPHVQWCPQMDLIGIISQTERMIEVHRVGFKH